MRLWGIAVALALIAFAACSKKKQTPAAVVGKVSALSGEVTATRAGAAPRALAVGAELWSDDTVKTGVGARVTVELASGAVYEMGAEAERKLGEVVALLEQGGSAGTGDVTAAAGRHGEQEAAGTEATAERELARTSAAREQKLQAAAAAEAERARLRAELEQKVRESETVRARNMPRNLPNQKPKISIGCPPGDPLCVESDLRAPTGSGPSDTMLSARDVGPALRAAQSVWTACATQVGPPGTAFTAKLRIEIQNGKVTETVLAEASGSQPFDQCVLQAARKLTFPQSSAASPVAFPIKAVAR